MEEHQARLLAEQLSHALDLLNARIERLEGRITRQEEIAALRLSALEKSHEDQETRLRAAGEALARLATTASLAQVLQAAFALILSAIAAWLGSR